MWVQSYSTGCGVVRSPECGSSPTVPGVGLLGPQNVGPVLQYRVWGC